jgi:hypothetical protein
MTLAEEPANKAFLRPKNSIPEMEGQAPFYCQSRLFTLARLLHRNAFRDHSAMESIFDVAPPKPMKSVTIAWKKEILEQPFYSRIESDNEIEKANGYHSRHMEAGIRAGMAEPPSTHDGRAYAIMMIGASVGNPDLWQHG